MIQEILEKLNKDIRVEEGSDLYTFSKGEVYSISLSGDDELIVKEIIARYLAKGGPFYDVSLHGDFGRTIYVDPEDLGKAAKVFESIVADIASSGKTLDDVFERIDELDPDECRVAMKKIMAILF